MPAIGQVKAPLHTAQDRALFHIKILCTVCSGKSRHLQMYYRIVDILSLPAFPSGHCNNHCREKICLSSAMMYATKLEV